MHDILVHAVRYRERDPTAAYAARLAASAGRGPARGVASLAGAAEVSAELLVAAAYGRSRLAEWALGGVTRHLLRHSTIPLLLRH